jgi:mono/diheme cytochrome c family protein
VARGRQVFAQACEVCHSISGRSRPSQQGGDLRMFHSSLAQLRQLTAEMPVLHHHRLSSAELSAVIGYVAAIESRN